MVQYIEFWLALLLLIVGYWLLPSRRRGWLLGFGSFAAIAYFDRPTALTMLLITVLVFAVLHHPSTREHRGTMVKICIFAMLFYLGYFKYFPVIGNALRGGDEPVSLILPLGISYFTFKLIHYALEVRRGTLPEHNFEDFLSFLFLFPIFTAGPIERFDHYIENRSVTFRFEFVVEGLTRISHGLIKKFFFGAIVVRLMLALTEGGGLPFLLDNLETISPWIVIAFLVLIYFNIYMDFSGYSDIAIGASRLFGLRIMENFNYPMLARNTGDLWRRWHMSLASWCQTYVYFPMLGITRNPYIAVYCSFFIIGLWHGASLNWIAWGLYNAVGVSFFQAWLVYERKHKLTFMKKAPFRYIGQPLTFIYFTGSCAFAGTDQFGVYAAVRLLARCLYIDLPA
ncbi:MBOAT family O-acyltransferase [uncultured Roseobacter sp.]|uniref:MBOAT family O-acyltransferase n=1 Tax=uncultured Roseobacter sp. TaxID=114847 RepID=UPI0026315C9F|nr:MBOAT family O-acyltransferase [uncultured Roseobacter sp.]